MLINPFLFGSTPSATWESNAAPDYATISESGALFVGHGTNTVYWSSACISPAKTSGKWFFSVEMVNPYVSPYYYDSYEFGFGLVDDSVATTHGSGSITAGTYPSSAILYAHNSGIPKKLVSNAYSNITPAPSIGNYSEPIGISYDVDTGSIRCWVYTGGIWVDQGSLATVAANTAKKPFAMMTGQGSYPNAGKLRLRFDISAPSGFSNWF